jgi:hypothetical protein
MPTPADDLAQLLAAVLGLEWAQHLACFPFSNG